MRFAQAALVFEIIGHQGCIGLAQLSVLSTQGLCEFRKAVDFIGKFLEVCDHPETIEPHDCTVNLVLYMLTIVAHL